MVPGQRARLLHEALRHRRIRPQPRNQHRNGRQGTALRLVRRTLQGTRLRSRGDCPQCQRQRRDPDSQSAQGHGTSRDKGHGRPGGRAAPSARHEPLRHPQVDVGARPPVARRPHQLRQRLQAQSHTQRGIPALRKNQPFVHPYPQRRHAQIRPGRRNSRGISARRHAGSAPSRRKHLNLRLEGRQAPGIPALEAARGQRHLRRGIRLALQGIGRGQADSRKALRPRDRSLRQAHRGPSRSPCRSPYGNPGQGCTEIAEAGEGSACRRRRPDSDAAEDTALETGRLDGASRNARPQEDF